MCREQISILLIEEHLIHVVTELPRHLARILSLRTALGDGHWC